MLLFSVVFPPTDAAFEPFPPLEPPLPLPPLELPPPEPPLELPPELPLELVVLFLAAD